VDPAPALLLGTGLVEADTPAIRSRRLSQLNPPRHALGKPVFSPGRALVYSK